ncbi:Protein CHROMATIN REMODELING 25 [Phytophthora fragariae]|uniref:Protein CHROMATIN REMODELING 25 n=1 Tax=Phytophthora fragariae TaxID=53985 RepID=A0A6A3YSV7_9STRA|nr:Protein CHROMATIN REMODELING 25 [Phytophthora fragariae]KAE8943740.1 Protein CHROMATIN REMODELING 25 [Phytophthora fragariae]KAE9126295.1 Protein CHROMATIN REMODELING 25 [Phytophthora fragariae]KAE9150385.1 Protein CHROMATIN REMODELING 25 [Phytophthora fragariae]KAE9224359.1 Protein CHROMATIN REMODELING 25 [Phytophthora fragariae]
MLRRRGGADAGAKFKPFVLPVKSKPARAQPQDEEEDTYEDEDAASNRQALLSGASLSVKRLPFLSFLVMEPERRAQHVRRPFKSPCGEGGRTQESNRLLQTKTLGMRRRWGSVVLKPMVRHDLPPLEVDVEEIETPVEIEPPAVEEPPAVVVADAPPPLVLWQSETDPEVKIVVPEIVGKFLRPHQREGVQFMFDCVCQIRGFDGQGCILADDMGLGKTLQSITLMYTLLMTGMDMKPTVKRAIVVCPTSLVKNWDDEIIKWLHGRVKTVALFEAKRETVIKGIGQFIEGSKRPRPGFSAQVLIISYETFRMHAQKFADAPECCDLLICDEAHRLKNANSQINKALSSLACRKRVLLSGTPMQNDLEEFFAMVDFTNPNILGTPSEFRKNYLGPILVGREPDSTDRERKVAQSCSAMLCEIVNQFILRRGNILNAKHLPPKLMQVICCPLSPLQEQLYMHFLSSSACRDMMKRQSANVLSSITALKKLCNHPLLIFDEMGKTNTKLPGFSNCAQYFAAAKESRDSGGDNGLHRRGGFGGRTCYPEWSGKMLLLDRLMFSMRKTTTDRIVIVSNYTQTLDVVSTLCQERHLPFVRLDGTTSAKKRKKLVDTFNDPTTNSFAFLLSSKAGGCGLNLIGANRLVLFDPDWNPATDKQAAARVWREGQKKMCYVYRFLASGTLEEKIFQRQLSKEGLQNIVDDKEEVNSLSSKDLKRLFVFRKDTLSDTHDQLKCDRCQWRGDGTVGGHSDSSSVITIDDDDGSGKGTGNEASPDRDTTSDEDADKDTDKGYHPQIGMPPEEDLNNWGHHRAYASVDDEVMQAALQQVQNDLVSFAFSCRIDWELLQEHQAENEEKENQRDEERKRKRLEIIAENKDRAEKEKSSKPPKSTKSKGIDESDESEAEYLSSSDDEAQDEVLGESESDSEGEEDLLSAPRRSSSASEVDISCTPKPPLRCPSPASNSLEASSHPVHVKTPQSPTSETNLKKRVSFASQVDISSPRSNSTKKQRFSELSDSDEENAFVDDVLSDPRPARKEKVVDSDEEHKESEVPLVWSCSRCTLINSRSNASCSSCGLRYRKSRPQIIDLGDDEDEDW